METLWQDVRYGIRTLKRSPGFTAVAVLTLALGIGANTAMFSVVHSVLLQPLDYTDSSRLVALFLTEKDRTTRGPTAPAFYAAWKETTASFDHLTVATPWAPVLTGREKPVQLNGLRASHELFDLLGVQPALGRTFVPAHGLAGQEQVVVVGHDLWQREFGGDPKVIGRTVQLDGAAYEIIAVMPPGFQFPPFWASDAELWVPLVFTPQNLTSRARYLRTFARLKPGVTVARAQAEMDVQARQLEQQDPARFVNTAINVEPLLEPVVGDSRTALYVLFGAVGFVLLIACANLANLLLARAVGRRGELAVRAALGARSGRLIRQLFTESVLLSGAGALLGVLLARWLLDALVLFGPGSVPRMAAIQLSEPVLLFTLALSVSAAILFGLVPAWQAARLDIVESVRAGTRHSTAGKHNRLRGTLVVAEVALAVMLLTGAGLLLKSFLGLRGMDPGFGREGRLTAVLSLGASRHASNELKPLLFDQVRERLAAHPAVQAIGFVNFLPIGGDIWGFGFAIEGRPEPLPEDRPVASYRVITPGYLEAIGTPLRSGRDFSAADTAKAQPVVLINEALARRYWPGDEPIGQRIRVGGAREPWRTIVGVMADTRQWELTQEIQPEVALPFAQDPPDRYSHATVVVRTSGDPQQLVRPLQEAVLSVEANIPLAKIRTMEEILSESVRQERFRSALIAGFSALSLLLAAVGIYGVMAYGVSQRTREIGIRVALGARPGRILRQVAGYGVCMGLLGIALGLAASVALGRVVESLLFQIAPTDPAVFVAVAAVMLGVTVAAGWVPAWRAARVDPMVALRYE